MLGLLALVGFFAIAAGVGGLPEYAAGFKQFGNNFAVPALFLHAFPSWFVGVAFAAIGIGAARRDHVDRRRQSLHAQHSPRVHQWRAHRQAGSADGKVGVAVVKFGALAFIVFVPSKYAIYLQLLGGIWIIQTLPAVMLGVYTRWFNEWALLIGWAVGIVAGSAMFIAANLTPTYALAVGSFTFPGYSALYAVIINLVLTVALTPLFNLVSRSSVDETLAAEYRAPLRA